MKLFCVNFLLLLFINTNAINNSENNTTKSLNNGNIKSNLTFTLFQLPNINNLNAKLKEVSRLLTAKMFTCNGVDQHEANIINNAQLFLTHDNQAFFCQIYDDIANDDENNNIGYLYFNTQHNQYFIIDEENEYIFINNPFENNEKPQAHYAKTNDIKNNIKAQTRPNVTNNQGINNIFMPANKNKAIINAVKAYVQENNNIIDVQFTNHEANLQILLKLEKQYNMKLRNHAKLENKIQKHPKMIAITNMHEIATNKIRNALDCNYIKHNLNNALTFSLLKNIKCKITDEMLKQFKAHEMINNVVNSAGFDMLISFLIMLTMLLAIIYMPLLMMLYAKKHILQHLLKNIVLKNIVLSLFN